MKSIKSKLLFCRLFCGLLICFVAPAIGQTLLKDIVPGSKGSNSTSLINVNGTLFFLADDGVHGRELWKSDGTAGGTVLVKDINPGPAGSDIKEMMVVNNLLFFSAFSTANNSNTRQLWRSDGSETGTFEPYDGHKDGEVQNPANLTKVGNLLFYVTRGSLGGTSQWLLSKSDGTDLDPQKNGGTGSFFTIEYDPVTDGNLPPANFTDVNGTLFFTYRKTLWTTTGQPTDPAFKATEIKKFSTTVNNLCAFKNKLYFSVGPTLWLSEGTVGTTQQLPGIGQIATNNIGKDILSLTPAGDYLYIVTGVNGRVLFASDGVSVSNSPQATAAGFIRLITNLPATKLPTTPGQTYFVANDNVYSLTTGSWSLKKLPGTYQGITNFVRVSNSLYFTTSAGLSRLESSVNKVESVFTIPVMFSTFNLTRVGNRLYVSTVLPDPGPEIYYVNAVLFNNNSPIGGK